MKLFLWIRKGFGKLRRKLRDNKKLRWLFYISIALFVVNFFIKLYDVLDKHGHWHWAILGNWFGSNGLWAAIFESLPLSMVVFFEHAWIEIISAVLVYFLLEDKFQNINRIPKNVGKRDHAKLLDAIAKNAMDEVRILDTSIFSFIKDYDLFVRSLEGALNRIDVDVKIKILLLHPDTYAAEQRSKDLTIDTRTLLENMKLGLGKLHTFISENLSEEQKKRVDVRLYKTTPMMIYVSWDTDANFGLLHPDNLADDKDTFIAIRESPLIRSFQAYFDDLWREKNLETGKTVFLEQYLFTNLTPVDTGKIIRGLYWGGNNENYELPRYIVELNENPNLDELQRISENNILVKIEHDNNVSYGKISEIKKTTENKKRDYAKTQIKKTFGGAIKNPDFTNAIFQIHYAFDTEISLINRNFVREKLDVKGYTFISHRQYDVVLSPLVRFSFENLMHCFEKDLKIDECDQDGISKIKENHPNYKSNARKRLMGVYTCSIDNGKIEVTTCHEDNIYPNTYRMSYEGVDFEKTSRKYTTISQILKQERLTKVVQARLDRVQRTILSTIKADILYLLGTHDLIAQNKNYRVYVHLIRTWVSSLNSESEVALPTPQKIDYTTCDYKAVHLVRRENITNGVTEIHINGELVDALLLLHPLDSVFF